MAYYGQVECVLDVCDNYDQCDDDYDHAVREAMIHDDCVDCDLVDDRGDSNEKSCNDDLSCSD